MGSNDPAISLRDPTNTKELELFKKAVAKGKAELRNEVVELVKSQSPPNDSPEAEKALRALLCPHGYEYDPSSLPDDGENYGNTKRKYA